jgi:hypothetical protein
MTIQSDMSGGFGSVSMAYAPLTVRNAAAAMDDVSYWVNAARFALYSRMHTTAEEYLNKATLLASLSGSDDCTAEIGKLADELRTRLPGAN